MENYEKKHKNTLEWARQVMNGETGFIRDEVLDVFPELKESEDDRIRKEMIFYFQEEIPQCSIQEHSDKMREFISWLKRQEIECIKLELKAGNSYFCYKSRWERADNETFKKGLIYKCNKDGVLDNFVIKNPEQHFIEIKDERIAWLEKQGEQKTADKVEPKFHEGEWIVWQDKCCKVNYNGCGYELIDQNGLSTSLEYGTADENAHLWDTTKDAEDGDVLVASDESVFIYAGSTDRHAKFYVALTRYGQINVGGGIWEEKNSVHPATKKQRDLLFQKMKEAGYEWDAEKKEPKKIDQNPAWNEEDEKKIKKVMHIVSLDGRISNEECKSIFDWLESLKERCTWKPSEEQMDALEHFVRSIGESGYASPYDNDTKLIYSLLEQLKQH